MIMEVRRRAVKPAARPAPEPDPARTAALLELVSIAEAEVALGRLIRLAEAEGQQQLLHDLLDLRQKIAGQRSRCWARLTECRQQPDLALVER